MTRKIKFISYSLPQTSESTFFHDNDISDNDSYTVLHEHLKIPNKARKKMYLCILLVKKQLR